MKGEERGSASGRVRDGCQWRRLLKAILAVAILVSAIPLSDMVVGVCDSGQGESTGDGFVGFADAFAESGGSPFAVLDGVEQQLERSGEADIPADFLEEIGVLDGAHEVRVHEDGCVVGYVVDSDEGESFFRLRSAMEHLGWSAVPLGEATGATFVKDAGTFSWALATCTQVGQRTSVVVRAVRA